MTPELEELKKEIADQMLEWADIFVTNRKAFLRKRQIDASGELINSLNFEIDTQARQEAVQLLIAFNDYGRMVDMKRFNYSHDSWGRNAVSRIEDWVKEKGLEKFIQGFVKKYNLKTVPANVLNKIAWGIMTNRAEGKFRRRRWYNKPKTAAISELVTQVVAIIPDKAAKQIKQQFDFKGYAIAKGREGDDNPKKKRNF